MILDEMFNGCDSCVQHSRMQTDLMMVMQESSSDIGAEDRVQLCLSLFQGYGVAFLACERP